MKILLKTEFRRRQVWWFTIQSSNGKTICTSEMYTSKRARDKAANLVTEEAYLLRLPIAKKIYNDKRNN